MYPRVIVEFSGTHKLVLNFKDISPETVYAITADANRLLMKIETAARQARELTRKTKRLNS